MLCHIVHLSDSDIAGPCRGGNILSLVCLCNDGEMFACVRVGCWDEENVLLISGAQRAVGFGFMGGAELSIAGFERILLGFG